MHRFYTDARAKVEVLDLKVASVKVGYITGSGEVPDAIRWMENAGAYRIFASFLSLPKAANQSEDRAARDKFGRIKKTRLKN